jgi:ABC-type Fe3+-citrate transport system substrate-binding protein
MGRARKLKWGAGVLFAIAATVATAGCDPANGLGASAVSATTDQLATHALKSDKVDVAWLSCSATTGKTEDKVTCLGQTDDNQKITVKGTVTEQLDQKCVKGHLVAVVGKKTVFDVRGLGNCSSKS